MTITFLIVSIIGVIVAASVGYVIGRTTDRNLTARKILDYEAKIDSLKTETQSYKFSCEFKSNMIEEEMRRSRIYETIANNLKEENEKLRKKIKKIKKGNK